jgi:predicted small secreted protein
MECKYLGFSVQNRRDIMIKKIILSVATSAFLIGIFGAIAGCNTVEGAGKDLEKGGEKIQDKAEEHK